MANIYLDQVNLNFPIYGTKSRSLKQSLLKITTGGKLYQSDRKVVVNALRNISLSLSTGDRLALIGHNGAGKSTLLKVLAGVYVPTHGKLVIEGSISSLLDITAGMEMEESGYSNIKIRGALLGLRKKQIQSLMPDIEKFTEIGNYLAMPVKTYSAGMRVRLAFAIATAVDPGILLLDEVLGAGDAHFMEKAQRRFKEFVYKSDILVLASHSNEILKQFCNKGLLLEQGSIKALGNIHDVLACYNDPHKNAS